MTKRPGRGGGFEILRRGLESLKRDLEAGRVSQRTALTELITDLPEVLVHIEAYIASEHDSLLREIQEQQRAARKGTPQARKPSGRPKRRPTS